MSDALPRTLGRYELVEKLAVGGMAELYKARVVGAHGFEKPLVIKRTWPPPTSSSRCSPTDDGDGVKFLSFSGF